MKLIFSTHNEGKIKEMRNILAGLDWEILSAQDVGITEEPVEDGKTYADNALIKARYVYQRIGGWTVADDSGLCVEALGGAPGVFSARWAGESATGEEKAEKILTELGDLPDEKRKAYFETAIALIDPKGKEYIFSGQVHGKITHERRGDFLHSRLPYDSIFIPDGWDRTFSEAGEEEKNKISHRGKAFREIKDFLSSVE
jgi:XTP/dITP diphosphohydrolase